jgi:hypothetical protein
MDAQVSKVQCYSGYRYDQRPYRFTWQDQMFEVEAVLRQENTPQGRRFLVRTDHGDLFALEYNQDTDQWQINPATLPSSNPQPTK